MKNRLKIVSIDEVAVRRAYPVDPKTHAIAADIVEQVKNGGENALLELAKKFGDLSPEAELFVNKQQLQKARTKIPKDDLALLERTVERIHTFATAQLKSLSETTIEIPGGSARQEMSPVVRAGCYAPGGRYPLPSSVLMTAVTARAAGVSDIWVASPRPKPIILAAAACTGANGLLCAGGAQAIAAMAFGAGPMAACDVVVGPGNRFVTAAKRIVFGHVGIDMLAGPSELVILADAGADPSIAAADLLAQAEHDSDACPILVSTNMEVIKRVNDELDSQLKDLDTKDTASEALKNGYAVLAKDTKEACAVCDLIAPEHLTIFADNALELSKQCNNYGALFLGSASAEVLGDYGAGPNHTLPTSGTARYKGGLNVFDFLRIRTSIQIDDPAAAKVLYTDCVRLAELEGLAAHARSAKKRLR